nr:hypothetical protein [Tanacetum cinerariifolium]
MSTLIYVDLETITQADGAQSSRVLVSLPDDPYVAVRHAQLVDTNTELELEEAPLEANESHDHTYGRAYLADLILGHVSPNSGEVPGTSELILDTKTEDESLDSDAEGEGSKDEGLSLDDEGHDLEDEGLGSEEEEEFAPEGEGSVPSTFEVGQSFWFMPEQEGAERISVFRQPTLVTWWSSGSVLVSTSYLVVLSPIASPVATLSATLSVDDGQLLERYRFRSLEREEKRATVTCSAIWRLILALEAWAGQIDA